MKFEAHAFLVIDVKHGAWGKGESLDEAVRKMRENLPSNLRRKKVGVVVHLFTCRPIDVRVEASVNVEWFFPADATAMKFLHRV